MPTNVLANHLPAVLTPAREVMTPVQVPNIEPQPRLPHPFPSSSHNGNVTCPA